jgi:hypothetical protein
MRAIEIFGEAAAELVPKIRDLNPKVTESLLTGLAETFLSELCQQLLRAHKELGHSPEEDDKAMLLLMFTEHGIKKETAEVLYREIITAGLEMPDSDEIPRQ